jgi:hypothetical protein
MRIAAAVLLLLAACSSGGGSVVDATQTGGPFAFAGGGFASDNPQFGRYPATEELVVIFENVSERPQTVDSILVRQVNETASPLRVDNASQSINRMIDPGEELEVKMLVRVTPNPVERGVVLGQRGISFDVVLRAADGTSYRYPIQVPLKTTVGLKP